ncbi:hypothetical protein BOX15_Mlig026886g3 [Macrostomum lignano]|uniref:Arrestin C-terminal-like domain-containing protein n=1 Tax=Macrostomum lignano TaxID=282301 RepID=A0A267DVG0_9PLAT|nr:hypothetical protein BOX15_Mlig026886g2 [Macrostomum lignano]PAA83753.1 hypothetical protein BOX15_Mlig026886g3 [Macrostomum lignano]
MVDYINKFDIELAKPVWYAGEELTGHIIVDSTENFKVRGIRVHLRGRGHVEWKVSRSGERHSVKEDQVYLDAKTTVWGIEKGLEPGGNDALPILPRGAHKWQFSFPLPESALPPSFESRTCTVRYYLRCIIDVPYASNPSHITYFTVIGPYSDCMETRYLCPTCMEISSHTCPCLPLMKPLRLSGTLERSAYCCGEHIKLRCQVANDTDRQLRISVKLVQDCCFFINQGVLGICKEFQHVAFEYRSDLIRARQSVDWDLSSFLLLPPVPPTIPEGFCRLMQIGYTLRVNLVRDGKAPTNLCLDFPFTIATLPFRIPNVAVPPVVFQTAVESVEGGMYISPAFTLGQVYDGTEGAESGLLYQPVYPTVMKNPAKLERQRLASIANGLNDCAEKVSSV